MMRLGLRLRSGRPAQAGRVTAPLALHWRRRWRWPARLVPLLVALTMLGLWVDAAGAATGDVGFAGPSTAGTGGAASGGQPGSKPWVNDGRWGGAADGA